MLDKVTNGVHGCVLYLYDNVRNFLRTAPGMEPTVCIGRAQRQCGMSYTNQGIPKAPGNVGYPGEAVGDQR